MKSHLFIPLALVLGFNGTAFGEGADQQVPRTQANTGSAYAAETMEHVETSTYAVPEVLSEAKTVSNVYLVEEQNREQYRQEMLKEQNRRALLDNVRSVQIQQVKAFLKPAQETQQVAQESAPRPSLETDVSAPASAAPAALDEGADRVVPTLELKLDELQVEDEQQPDPEQEPS
ncbi:hypothetical protein [Microbulbifer sp. HZ11]|uniref:hypothetical protein n=1 Tax=unclassified Microbulbifer TaxID=2619833 RepID=UPI0005BB0B8A|nr:hypothetical protein [Microbulbifer sp. HZ11]